MSRQVLLIAAGLLALAGCAAPATPDYAAQYRPMLDTYIDVWNGADPGRLDAVFAEDSRRISSGGMTTENLAALKKLIADFRTASPDMKVVLDDNQFLDGQSFHLWTATATNTGPGAMPPTGKGMKVSGMTRFRYKDGKIVEELVYFDALDMQTQLGYTLTPPAPAEATAAQ